MGARLGLGTAPFLAGYGVGDGDAARPDDQRALLHAALDGGIRDIDTSPVYGDAEARVGEVAARLREVGARIYLKYTAAAWRTGLAGSLERLRQTSVDCFMIHNADAAVLEDRALAGDLQRLKASGLVRRAGASTYGTTDAVAVLAAPWCDVIQVEHSLLNPRVVAALLARKRAGQEIVVRSVLCKGLLTSRRTGAAVDGAARRRLDALAALAAAWGFEDLSDLAVRYALDTPGVDVVLVGVATAPELAAAFRGRAHAPLTAAQRAALVEFDHAAEDWTHPERWAVPA